MMKYFEKLFLLLIFKKHARNGLFSILVGGMLLLSGCGSKELEQAETTINMPASVNRVFGPGRIEPELKILELTSETNGTIQKIYFQPGQFAQAGQKIIELTNEIEQAKVAQALAKIKVQTFNIEAARARLAATKVQTDFAKSNLERARRLFEQNAEAKFNYETAETEYQSLTQEVKRLEAELATAEGSLKENQAAYQLARAELNRKFITAPTDGQILSLDVTIGSLISVGVPFGTFAPNSALSAWCEIDELYAPLVHPEQKAFLRSQGMADTLAWGKVSFVGPYLRKKSIFSDDVGVLEDRRVREVRILLEPEAKILFGTRVECVIITD